MGGNYAFRESTVARLRRRVAVSENFTKTWRGWVRSSEGYEIRILGRTGIEYRDARGEIQINAEAMSSPWNEILVYSASIPDTQERPRAEVLDRLGRAFEFRGWILKVSDA